MKSSNFRNNARHNDQIFHKKGIKIFFHINLHNFNLLKDKTKYQERILINIIINIKDKIFGRPRNKFCEIYIDIIRQYIPYIVSLMISEINSVIIEIWTEILPFYIFLLISLNDKIILTSLEFVFTFLYLFWQNNFY